MGVKLRKPEHGEFSNALEKRPALAGFIGLIVSEYSNAEMIMAIVFAHLLGLSEQDRAVGINILDAINGNNQKRNQIVAVSKAKVKDQTLLDQVVKAVDALNDAGVQRDNVAHGKWCTCDCEKHKAVLLWQKTTAGSDDGFEVYDEKRLVELANRIIHWRNELQGLIPKIQAHLSSL